MKTMLLLTAFAGAVALSACAPTQEAAPAPGGEATPVACKAGDYQGGGITGGYRLPLTRHWAFDFHAAAGYTRAEYDEYTRIGTVNVLRNKSGKLVKDYWGINQLGVSLLYDF